MLLLPALSMAVNNDVLSERDAYNLALKYIGGTLQSKDKSSDSAWIESLKVLSTSKSVHADKYLSKIATLRIDGSAAEDLSCAMSHRVAVHGKPFLKALQFMSDNYDNENPCNHDNQNNKYQFREAACLTKDEFSALVVTYESLKGKPEDNSEVDCSYIYKK